MLSLNPSPILQSFSNHGLEKGGRLIDEAFQNSL